MTISMKPPMTSYFSRARGAAALTLLMAAVALPAFADGRVTTSFDPDWRFLQADAKDAQLPTFADASWRKLAVPHDWSIEGAYDQANPAGRGGGYLPAGIGWYRKHFTLPASDAGQRVRVEFDGVMANSDVWINGHHLGKRPFGYSSFMYDLTGHLKFGKGEENVLAVRADNTIQPASRYYTGAGIYRHVRLVSTAPVHFGAGGVYVSTPHAGADKATVKVVADVVNESGAGGEFILQSVLLDPAGKAVQRSESRQLVGAGKAVDIVQEIALDAPQRWSPGQPSLYKLVATLKRASVTLDETTTPFGIRAIRFEADTGFWINDVNMKLKGVALHHDAGAFGAAVPVAAWQRRLELLRAAGANAIRTAHNPVAPEFLDLCDRMGFLVMDETFDTWMEAKHHAEQGYQRFWADWWEADTRAMVVRDRNHPSIVIYSIGNEIHDNLNNPEGFQKYKQQQDLVHKLDPTRPVTMALFRPALSKVYENGFAETMDVVGQNYRENELVAAHVANPKRKVIGTENTHVQSAWLALRDNAFMSGQFLWTGFDYLGEADWPAVTNGQGLFDRVGNWRPLAYQRQSWWSATPVVHIVRKDDNAGAGKWVANWTPVDFDTYDEARVEAYSNADEVELFLNDQSLGKKAKPANDGPRGWTLTFAKGTLRAVARNGGREVASDTLVTAGAPARIALVSERAGLAADWEDAGYVKATVVDVNGVPCPNATTMITFAVEGAGVLAAVDSGDLTSHARYQGSQCAAYQGQCSAIVKASGAGQITLKASAPGLAAASVMLAGGSVARAK
jgi:beta-galactosidase